jgi:DNA modification methylase
MKTNILYFGDNLNVLRERIDTESVDLIYIDPPFSSARNYFVIFKNREGNASDAQVDAFSDTWEWGEIAEAAFIHLIRHYGPCGHALAKTITALRAILDASPMMAYLVGMALRIVELHRVLKPTGSFYLHCDPTASHYLKGVRRDLRPGDVPQRDHMETNLSPQRRQAQVARRIRRYPLLLSLCVLLLSSTVRAL